MLRYKLEVSKYIKTIKFVVYDRCWKFMYNGDLIANCNLYTNSV